jgi:hypothetical protein
MSSNYAAIVESRNRNGGGGGYSSPLYSPSYPNSNSSHDNNSSNPYLFSSQQDHGVSTGSRNLNGSNSSMGGQEYGPYAPLNRRNNANSSYDDDHRSFNSSKERLVPSAAISAGSAMVDMRGPEPDDFLHDPKGADSHSHAMSLRGVLNVITLMILVAGLLMLFAGYPVLYHFLHSDSSTKGAYGLGGTNGTGQVAKLNAIRPLIDPDTPANAKTFASTASGKTYHLQFSDEFETEGRTFWPGDDQYVSLLRRNDTTAFR